MDTFSQVAAYAAKLSSLVPAWMLLIVADKHLLGLPVLQGSLWRSPRIPPRFTINGHHGGDRGSKPNSGGNGGRGSGSNETPPHDASQVERGFAAFTQPFHQPSQASQSLPEFAQTLTIGSTAVIVYQPLEVHDPFTSSSHWLEPGYAEKAGLCVCLLVLTYTIAKKSWRSLDKSEKQRRKTGNSEALAFSLPPPDQPAERTDYQIGFEYGFECGLLGVGLLCSETTTSPPTAPPPRPTLSLSPITSVQMSPSLLAIPPPPAAQLPGLSLSAIISVDIAPPIRVSNRPVLNHFMIISDHSTPSAVPSIAPATLHRNAAESVQDDGDELDEVEVSTGAIKAVVAALKEGEEGWERGPKDEAIADLERHSSSVNANDVLDEVSAEGEVRKKKKKIRQNAKRRMARRLAEEEASKEEVGSKVENASQEAETSKEGDASREETARNETGKSPNASIAGTKVFEGNQEKSKDKLKASGFLESGLGGEPKTNKKDTRRPEDRKHEVKIHARYDTHDESDNLTGNSQREIVVKKTRTSIKGQEWESALAKDMNAQARQLLVADEQGTELIAIRVKDETQKQRRRRKRGTFLSGIILDSWEEEEAQVQPLSIVDGWDEVLLGEVGKPVVKLPAAPDLGRAQVSGSTNPDAPTERQHEHTTNFNPSQYERAQDGGHYRRMIKLLDNSVLRTGHTGNGAISDIRFDGHNSPINRCHQSSFRCRTPVIAEVQNGIPSVLPWAASAHPNARQPYIYADQERANPAQKPVYFGPGVEPQTFAGRSGSTLWASNHPLSWRTADSPPSQVSWNKSATRTWVTSASAGLVQRGRLPYPIPPLEQSNNGLLPNTDFAPSIAPSHVGPQSSIRYVTSSGDGLAILCQGLNSFTDNTSAEGSDGLGNVSAFISADRSLERYKYLPERGIRSRSSPPKSRSQSPSPVRNGRPQSSPPRILTGSEAESLTQVEPNAD